MKTIAGGFLTVFGIGWIGILALMYQVEKLAEGKRSFVMTEALIIAAPGLILLGVGLFLFITGKISDRKLGILMAQKAQRAEDIASNGIPARARVTWPRS